ncbi:MAG: AAC(3) family N-acetyltransferase [Christensenellaceae bacterium]|nr:AAC(3) family N-acetyltransferase [Christensenellaceae bacterium]
MTESQRFQQQLIDLGLKPGDTVLVHASMKALNTARTPEEIIEDIQQVLGGEGTLLFPALTYESVNSDQPVFNSETAEPCVGLLPSTFRKMPGVERSVHPTHSVCARGRLAHTLTVGHAMDDTAVGPHSPFMLLPVYGGKLLFIGDVLHACTMMHGVEDIVQPPYIRRVKTRFTVNGQEREYIANDDYGWGAEFQRIGDLLEEPDIRRGTLGEGPATLIDARALLAAALMRMRAEPYAFVTDISRWI